MTIIVLDCPHCDTRSVSFNIIGLVPVRETKFRSSHPSATFTATCAQCAEPVVGWAVYSVAGASFPALKTAINNVLGRNGTLQESQFRLAEYWPSTVQRAIPAHLSPTVEKALLQAERIYALPESEEPAAIMYRRSVELALGELFPAYKGSLAARIKQAVNDGHLPQTMSDWANEVRLVGNEGAHDGEGVSRHDLSNARNFVDALLRYLFTLPAMVQRRREHREDLESDTVER